MTLSKELSGLAGAHAMTERKVSSERVYRHKKRGTEYVMIGIGKMQAENWIEQKPGTVWHPCVDMRDVAIYRSVTDPTEIWVRPREEFEDGRFEALPEPTPVVSSERVSGENEVANEDLMLEALRLHKAWSDSESAGPDYGGLTRDTHPDGETIWEAWWNNQLDLCDRANKATDLAIAKAEGRS